MQNNSKIRFDTQQYNSEIHGYKHTQKVNFYLNVLATLDNLDAHSIEILDFASKKHDIGRENDDENKYHGENGVKVLKESGELEKFSEDDQDLICFLIREHSKTKSSNEQALDKLPEEKKIEYKKLLNYLKDADKLDRVRLGTHELDSNKLMLPTSKKLIKAAIQSQNTLYLILNLEWAKRTKELLKKAKETIQDYKMNGLVTDVNIQKIKYLDDCYEQLNNENLARKKLSIKTALLNALKQTSISEVIKVDNILEKTGQKNKEGDVLENG